MPLAVKQGLRFDGISNNVSFNQPIVGFGLEGGYELRFKDLKPINGAYVLGGNAGVRTYIQSFSTGILTVIKGNPGVGGSGSAPLDSSLEHTASLFWKNGIYYFYVDGTLVESLSFSDTSDGNTVRIGSHTSGTGPLSAFTALRFRQYNRLLSSTEIASNHNGQVTRSGLVGEWLFKEGTGTTVTDTSGSGNHGTINGATWLIKKAPQKSGGKNLVPTDVTGWEQGSVLNTNAGVQHGKDTGTTTRIRLFNDAKSKPNTTYTVSVKNGYEVFVFDIDTIGNTLAAYGWVTAISFTTGATNDKVYALIRKTGGVANIAISEVSVAQLQIEQGSTATAFEAYQPINSYKTPSTVKASKRVLTAAR